MKHFVFALFFALSSVGWACIGGDERFDISFAPVTSSDDLIINVKVNGELREELLDDTGFLSSQLAFVNIYKSSKIEIIKANDFSETIRFMKMRLAVLKKVYGQFKVPTSSIDSLDSLLSKSSFTKSELLKGWDDVNSARWNANLEISAASRSDSKSKWKPEQPIENFKLPRHFISKGGCNSTISRFNTDGALNKPQTPEKLPSFNFGSGQ